MDRIQAMIASAKEQFEAMTPRDRNLATILVVALALLLSGGLTYYLKGVLDTRASYVRVAKESLEAVQEMAAEYSVVKEKLDKAEARMGTFKANQINTHLETWARDAQMGQQLREVTEGSSQVVGRFKERLYRVEIRDAPYGALVAFLYKIETSNTPVRIRSANLKGTGGSADDDRKINANLELVTYAKQEGEG